MSVIIGGFTTESEPPPPSPTVSKKYFYLQDVFLKQVSVLLKSEYFCLLQRCHMTFLFDTSISTQNVTTLATTEEVQSALLL